MNRTLWRIALVVPWLVVGFAIWELWTSWPQFPARVATHFNYYGQADGWTIKGPFPLAFVLVPVIALAVLTLILSRVRSGSGAGWILLVLEYWVTAVIGFVNHGIVQFNLAQTDRLSIPFVPVSILAVLAALGGVILRASRIRQTASVQGGGLLAEEKHNSPRLAGLFGVIGLGFLAIALVGPGPMRVGMGLGLAVMLFCAGWAWKGFEYRITTAGIEVRSFGISLRFVGAAEITQYAAQECRPLREFGGYGIRGVGSCRAYIWGGNRVVHIRTHDSDLYLGHSDPDRLVRELDDMKQLVR